MTKSNLHSRLVALDVLVDIFKNKRPLDTSFDYHCSKLNKQDSSFAFALINFVLRHLVIIDTLIDSYMDKPYKVTSSERQILRIGLAQLLFMESVEEFACIHTSVELAKQRAKSTAATVNAILRRAQKEAFDFVDEHYELIYEVPTWISDILKKDYPQKAYSLKTAMLSQGDIYLRLRNKNAQEFLKKNATMVKYLPGCWKLKENTKVNDIPGLDNFSVYVQDVASQLVSFILAAKVEEDGNLNSKINLLDLCAAPGGKTMHLGDLLPFANITACDNNPKRLETLQDNISKAFKDDLNRFNIVLNDATKPSFDKQSFDYILLDAPCSGLGISRKHIDVLHLRTQQELAEITKLQQQILPKAFDLLKPGGVMMYSTCSLLKDEGERQIDKFIEQNQQAEVINIENYFNEVGKITHQGYLRTFPTEKIDGFFMALIKKTK